MHGLYEALGRIAAAAHANDDVIDRNTFPKSDQDDRHGLDIYHDELLLQFRAVADEPQFVVESSIVFAPRLRRRYSPQILSDRADVEYDSLSAAEQEEIEQTILRADLREAETYEPDFQEAVHSGLTDMQPDLVRLGYGDDDIWNGVLIRDRLFPYRDSFSPDEYRDTVSSVQSVRKQVDRFLVDIPPIAGDQSEIPGLPPDVAEDPESLGFY